MFRRICNLKWLFRTKTVIFWTFLYPIALAMLIFMAYGNLGSAQRFETINVAVVWDTHFSRGTSFYTALSSVSDLGGESSDDDVFHVALTDEKTADRMLAEGEVSGIISYDGAPALTVSDSGYDQTIIRGFLESYRQIESTITQVVKENPGALRQRLIADIADRTEYIHEDTGNITYTTVICFFTLLAMTRMFGGTAGAQETIRIQPELSPLAAHRNVAHVQNFRMFLASVSAARLLQFVIMLLVLAFVVFVLGIDFGLKSCLVLLISRMMLRAYLERSSL
jgi:ABC-2 type transport system permease protein